MVLNDSTNLGIQWRAIWGQACLSADWQLPCLFCATIHANEWEASLIQNISSTWLLWKTRPVKTKYFVCKNLVKFCGQKIWKIDPKLGGGFFNPSNADILGQWLSVMGWGWGEGMSWSFRELRSIWGLYPLHTSNQLPQLWQTKCPWGTKLSLLENSCPRVNINSSQVNTFHMACAMISDNRNTSCQVLQVHDMSKDSIISLPGAYITKAGKYNYFVLQSISAELITKRVFWLSLRWPENVMNHTSFILKYSS